MSFWTLFRPKPGEPRCPHTDIDWKTLRREYRYGVCKDCGIEFGKKPDVEERR